MTRKDIEKELSIWCKKLGFRKKKYNYYKPLTDSIMATLGFGCTSFCKNEHNLVNVTIGVFYKEVDEVYSKLTGYSGYSYMQPTIGSQLGYLMPINDFYEWEFIDDADNSKKISDIFDNIIKYGFPYQAKMSDFDNLFNAYYRKDSGVLNVARQEIMPILYYMKGEKEKGVEFIKETIAQRSVRPTDEELLAGRAPKSTIILRAGEGPKLTGVEMEKMLKSLPSGGSINIIGSGCNGHVDPLYLEFAKRYEQL